MSGIEPFLIAAGTGAASTAGSAGAQQLLGGGNQTPGQPGIGSQGQMGGGQPNAAASALMQSIAQQEQQRQMQQQQQLAQMIQMLGAGGGGPMGGV